eukprot:COSAG01_NODE_152_length_23937_cov_122.193976_7_plen_93_part_00
MDFGRATRGWRPPTPQNSASGSQDPHLPTLMRILRSVIIITLPRQTNRALPAAAATLLAAGRWALHRAATRSTHETDRKILKKMLSRGIKIP